MEQQKTDLEIEMEMEAALAAFDEVNTAAVVEAPVQAAVPVRAAALPGAEAPIAALFDLALPVTIELGRTSMRVQEVLHLGRGSVIELDRLAGEPVDIFVGDRRFAEGEVVVLGENFGVRITRIIPPTGSVESA